METIQLRTHIGEDGLLKIETPVNAFDADVYVVIIYNARPRKDIRDWATFVNEMYGILADDLIERAPQPSLDVHESVA